LEKKESVRRTGACRHKKALVIGFKAYA